MSLFVFRTIVVLVMYMHMFSACVAATLSTFRRTLESITIGALPGAMLKHRQFFLLYNTIHITNLK